MRILIVEDDATMVVYLKKCLEAEGFSVDTACDGLVGLEKALTQHFDAITLDIMLPGMNGYEVCRELRAAQVDAPILMLTAKDGEYDEADAFDYGADDFLRKPFSLVVLSARLRSLIRRSGPPVTSCSTRLPIGSHVLGWRSSSRHASSHCSRCCCATRGKCWTGPNFWRRYGDTIILVVTTWSRYT